MRTFGSDKEYDEGAVDGLRREVRRLRVFSTALAVITVVSLFVMWSLCSHIVPMVSDMRASLSSMQTQITDVSSASDSYVDTGSGSDSGSAQHDSRVDELCGRMAVAEENMGILQDNMNILQENIGIVQDNIEILDEKISALASGQPGAEVVADEPEEVPLAVVPSGYEGFVELKGDVLQPDLDGILYYYSLVPANVRQAFESDGWKLVILSGNINYDKFNDTDAKVGAITVYREKVIYLTVYDLTSVMHEMGHYLDYKNGFCSLSFPADVYASEWRSLLAVDGETHHNNYSTTTEYFAESFNMWVEKNSEFCAACPGTAAFIEEHLGI